MTNGGCWLLLLSITFWAIAFVFSILVLRQHDVMNAFFVFISLAGVGTLLTIAVNQAWKQ